MKDDHVNKDIIVLGDTFMNSFNYNLDWNSDENMSRPDRSDEDDTSSEELDDSFDSWSLVWYIASFGGLVAFFLVVSCSEWCCRKHVREQQSRRGLSSPSPSLSTESPPPSYELFAPPSYESLNAAGSSEKSEFDVYVVPVHAIGSLVDENVTRQREEDPPSYNAISEQNLQTEVNLENRQNPRVSDA
ncbi:uncharacterized protein [Onthophagus taurus]|uniref:uncharacterized protein isoform X2 n=1 Tax=Onthophagus taurus TaxID=166361 RepID=UPI000C1FFA02|nr:uncharacterized protein LOC111426049 isoform X2 [Onthophagus taurus]